MENQLFLQLGDVIRIISPKNTNYDNKKFYIKYVDTDKVMIINKNESYTLNINEHKLSDESIKKIELLHRSDKNGFAEQNNLFAGTWVDIYFKGDVPLVITGEITSKEEDMIELTLFPNNQLIYIDFGYKGIDPELNIEKIIIRKNKPTNDEDDKEKLELKDETEKPITEPIIEENDEEYYVPNENKELDIQEVNNIVDNIILGEDLGVVSQAIKVRESEMRYGLDIQTNDLLNKMIEKIEDVKLRKIKNKEIIKNVDRFTELRDMFSEFDTFGNPQKSKKQGAYFKPLVSKFKDFEKIDWIVPIIKIKNKLYNVDSTDVDEQQDINMNDVSEMLYDVSEQQEKYEKNIKEGDENRFVYRTQNIINILKPFEISNFDENLIKIEAKNDVDCIINNNENYLSTSYYDDQLFEKKNKIQRATSGRLNLLSIDDKSQGNYYNLNQYIPNDEIYLKSILFLPDPFIQQSRMYLPNTNIFDKSLLNENYMLKEYFLNNIDKVEEENIILDNPVFEKNEEVYYINNNRMYLTKIKEVFTESYPEMYYTVDITINNESRSIKVSNDFLHKKINYSFDNTSNYNYKGNDLNKLLDIIIPKNKDLLNKINISKSHTLSIYDICNKLEPFGIYNDNISFMFYKAIVSTIIKERSSYLKYIVEHNNIFSSYRNMVDNHNKRNTIKSGYAEIKKIYSYNYSDSEFINYALNTDTGELLNIYNVIKNKDLFSHANIESINNFLNTKLMQKEEKENKKCVPKKIAKDYYDIKYLEVDNGENIYYDKDRDDTIYDILDIYRKEQNTMDNDEFKTFLISKLMEVNGLSQMDANYNAIALVEGRKKVEELDFAILHTVDEDNKDEKVMQTYYKRVKDVWIHDPSQENVNFIDMVEADNCNIQEECLKTENNGCESINTLNKSYVKKMVEKLLVAFDHEYYGKKQHSEEEMEALFEKKQVEFGKYKILTETKNLYLNTHMKNISKLKSIQLQPVEKSPHYDKLQEIMAISDFSQKQEYLLHFIEKYTRTPSSKENQYMLYCIDSDTELVPTFRHTICSTYSKNGNVEKAYELICKTQGVISEDGDAWVDEHTGRTIKQRHFDTSDTYDEQGVKVKRLILEQDLNDDENDESNSFLNEIYDFISEIETSNIQNYENEDSKYIYFILGKLIHIMALNIGKEHLDTIIYVIYTTYKSYYYTPTISSTNKKKALTILTVSTFTTCLQLFHKSIRINKTISGCSLSLKGFPIYNKTDDSLLNYISCITKALSKEGGKNNPFKIFNKIDSKAIISSLRKTINDDILTNSLILSKITEMDTAIEEEITTNKWQSFLPHLELFSLNIVKPIDGNIIQKIKTKLSNKQNIKDEYNLIESKIIELGYGVQYLIQQIIRKKKPILKTITNEAFLENACCDDNDGNILLYFINNDKTIMQYLEMLTSYEQIKNTLKLNTTVYCTNINKFTLDLNPKIKTEFKYNDELIYRCFLKYCRWESNNLKNTDLVELCGLKNIKFHNKDTIEDKIEKIKNENINLNQKILEQLLQRVRKESMFIMNYSKKSIDNIGNLISFFSVSSAIDEQLKPIQEITRIFDVKYGKEVEQGVKKDFSKENIEAVNILSDELDKKIKKITEYLTTHINLNKKDKTTIKILQNCLEFKSKDESLKQANDFGFNVISNLCCVYPSQIMKKHKIDNKVAKHWNLAKEHQKQLRSIYDDERKSINELYSSVDERLNMILQKVLYYSPIYKQLSRYLPLHYENNISIPFFSLKIINKIVHYLIITILESYVNISVDISETMEYDNAVQLQRNNANMILTFLNKINDSKQIINFDYNTIMKKVKRTKEAEKKKITDGFKKLNDEAREVENLKKKHRIGPDWSKGLQKSLFSYDKETYENEQRELMGDDGINNYLLSELQENDDIGEYDDDFNYGGLEED